MSTESVALDPLAAQTAAGGDRPAVIDDSPVVDGSPAMSFTDLNAEVNRIANALARLGVAAGERAAWCGPNSARVLVFMHACRKLGLVAIPLPYRLATSEMSFVLADSQASLVVVDHRYAATVAAAVVPGASVRDLVVLDAAGAPSSIAPAQGYAVWNWSDLTSGAPDHEPAPPEGDALGTAMMYTSGTTGRPKGAVRSRTDRALLGAMMATLGFGQAEVHLTTGPLYHAGPNAFALLANLTGGAVVIMERFDAARWLQLVRDHRVTSTFSTPTHLKRVLALDADVLARADLSSMRTLIVNAAPVPYSLKEQIVGRFGDGFLYEVYGSTELGIDTVLGPSDQLRKPGSCGRPYGGIEVRVTDDDGRDVEVGEVGELYFRTPLAIDGYRGSHEMRSLDGGWHSVGDLGHLDDEGFVYICDRRDDLIITAGANVYPAEVEAVIHAHPGVADVAVLGMADEEYGARVHAVVAPWPRSDGSPGTVDVAELEAFCRRRLAGYKVPRSWDVRPDLPRTESGKLLKRELRAEAGPI